MAEIKVIKIENSPRAQRGVETIPRYTSESLRGLNREQLLDLRNRLFELKVKNPHNVAIERLIKRELSLINRVVWEKSQGNTNPITAQTTRSEVLGRTSHDPDLLAFKPLEITLSPTQLKESIKTVMLENRQFAKEVIRERIAVHVVREIKVDTPVRAVDILARVLVAQTLKNFMPEPSRSEYKKAGTYVQEILQALSHPKEVAPARSKKTEGKDGTSEKKTEEQAPREVAAVSVSESAGALGSKTVKINYDKKGNIISFEIVGKTTAHEAVEGLKQLVRENPKEIIPLISSIAASSAENAREALPILNEILDITIAKHEPNSNPTPETIQGAIIRSVLSNPRLIPADRMEIAQKIVLEDPKTALSALLKETVSARDPEITRVIETLLDRPEIQPAIQKEVIAAFRPGAKDQTVPLLVSTELGENILIKTAENLAKMASTKVPAQSEPMREFIREFASANKSAFTRETAEDFIRLVAQVEKEPDKAVEYLAGVVGLKAPAIPVAQPEAANLPLPGKSAYAKSFERIADVLEKELAVIKTQNLKRLDPLANITPAVKPLNKLPPSLVALYQEIWRLLDGPLPETAQEEIKKVLVSLRGRLATVSEGIKGHDTLALIPLFNAVLMLKIKKIARNTRENDPSFVERLAA